MTAHVSTQPDLFDRPAPQDVDPRPIVGKTLTGMVRANNPETSLEAAQSVVRHRTALQVQILHMIQGHPMTDEELERLPELRDYGPSTVRKRRSELYQEGLLREDGDKLNSRGRMMTVWRAVA